MSSFKLFQKAHVFDTSFRVATSRKIVLKDWKMSGIFVFVVMSEKCLEF